MFKSSEQTAKKGKSGNKYRKPLTADEVQKIVETEIDNAGDFIDSEIAGLRILADKYFQGETVLPFEKGRSGIIVTKVRDTVRSIIPSVARLFTQNETVAEFTSEDEEDEKLCKDATLFVNQVYNKFGGYNATIMATTDALKARIGVVKVSLEKKKVGKAQIMESMTVDEFVELTKDESIEITEVSDPDEDDMVDVVATRYSIKKIWHLDPVPPENFIVNQTATSCESAHLIGTREEMRIYDAVAMGLDYDELCEADSSAVGTNTGTANTEKQERTDYNTDTGHDGSKSKDKSSEIILICEVYVRMDADGDGVTELRHIITAGNKKKVLVDEPCNHNPYGIFRVDLQPHVFFPISVAEDAMQDQDAQTSLTRSILDNTALVNSPRTEVNEAKVNLDDVKNNEIGAIIRVKAMGNINELATPFVAGETLPVLAHLQSVSEQRSGVTRLSQGLDPNALQSVSRVAGNAAVQGSDSRIEMMVRNIGETGIKSMFIAILRIAMEELKGEQSVKTGSGYQSVRPDQWHDEMSMVVSVGLGNGRIDEKVAALTSLAATQQAIILKLGLNNPICSWENLRTTYRQILRLAGLKTITDYFPNVDQTVLKQIDDEEKAAAAQANQAPPAPDIVGAEKVKGEVAIQINDKKLETQSRLKLVELRQKGTLDMAQLRQKHTGEMTRLTAEQRLQMQMALLEDDRLRDKQEMDYAVDAKKVDLDAQTKLEVAETTAAVRQAEVA